MQLHYGNLITFKEPQLVRDRWHVELKVDYPVILDDDKTEERFIKFLSFGRIGHLQFDRHYVPVEVSPREECTDTLRLNLDRWREQTERIVVEATARNLARLGRVREALHPMFVIVHRLATKESIPFSEIEEMRRPDRKHAYASLLEHDGILRRIGNGYTYGNTYVSILEKLPHEDRKDVDKIMESVVEHVIEQDYSVIREVFQVSRLDPYVHLDSCLYQPSLQAGRLLHQKQDKLFSRYNSLYPPFSTSELSAFLHDLVKTEAARQVDDDFYVGSEDAFQRMREKSAELSDSVPLAA